MSTEHQKYSTQNQSEAIAAYAARRGFTIVKTYADEGRSGLTFEARDALKRLIDDVRTRRADFNDAMPRYFFDIKDGHRLIDPAGQECDNDRRAIDEAKLLAVGVALDQPAVDPERHIAVLNEAGDEIFRVPIYSKVHEDQLNSPGAPG